MHNIFYLKCIICLHSQAAAANNHNLARLFCTSIHFITGLTTHAPLVKIHDFELLKLLPMLPFKILRQFWRGNNSLQHSWGKSSNDHLIKIHLIQKPSPSYSFGRLEENQSYKTQSKKVNIALSIFTSPLYTCSGNFKKIKRKSHNQKRIVKRLFRVCNVDFKIQLRSSSVHKLITCKIIRVARKGKERTNYC